MLTGSPVRVVTLKEKPACAACTFSVEPQQLTLLPLSKGCTLVARAYSYALLDLM